MKKVYFAGSIRSGRADADLYKRIIQYILHPWKAFDEQLYLALVNMPGGIG